MLIILNLVRKYVYKILVGAICLATTMAALATDLVHPLDFKGTKDETGKVIDFITSNVKETYRKAGISNSTMLRKMEREEVNSFRELTKVKDRKLLNEVIATYCKLGRCNYNTILMMYNEKLEKILSGRPNIEQKQNQS